MWDFKHSLMSGLSNARCLMSVQHTQTKRHRVFWFTVINSGLRNLLDFTCLISKTKGKWLKTSKITVQNWLKLLKINFCQFRLIKNQSKSIFVDFELIFDDFCQFWSIFIDFRQFFNCQDWLQTSVMDRQPEIMRAIIEVDGAQTSY